jgi:pimeloyl-ACP methyl ester carboxylesterase
MTFDFARLLQRLMVDELGPAKFAVHGGDWGGMVAEHLARSHASPIIGVHLTTFPFFTCSRSPRTRRAPRKST